MWADFSRDFPGAAIITAPRSVAVLAGRLDALRHFHNGKVFPIGERQVDALLLEVAVAAVERDAGEGGSHFKARKAFGPRGLLTELEDAGADALARPGGVDEEGADFGGVDARGEEGVVASRTMVAAIGGFAARPATAGSEVAHGWKVVRIGGCGDFDGKVGLVGDELCVKAEPGADSLLDLRGRVIVGLQTADGGLDERTEVEDVGWGGEAVVEEVRHRAMLRDVEIVNLTSIFDCGIIIALCAPPWLLMTTCSSRSKSTLKNGI